MDLDIDNGVAVLTWGDRENRFNRDSLAQWSHAVDQLEAYDGPLALVATGVGKFFCNGVDIDQIGNDVEVSKIVAELRRLLSRLLVLPAYSVCAINGHAYGAGAILTCAFDHRIMRADRGFWCANEAAIGMALDEGLMELVLHRLERRVGIDAVLRSTRYGGNDAAVAGIVEETASERLLLTMAIDQARRTLGLDRRLLADHKRLIHGRMADVLAGSL